MKNKKYTRYKDHIEVDKLKSIGREKFLELRMEQVGTPNEFRNLKKTASFLYHIDQTIKMPMKDFLNVFEWDWDFFLNNKPHNFHSKKITNFMGEKQLIDFYNLLISNDIHLKNEKSIQDLFKKKPKRFEWNPIETAPKDVEILIYSQDGIFSAMIRSETKYQKEYLDVTHLPSCGCGCWSEEDAPPTHWMPLPKPPEGIK